MKEINKAAWARNLAGDQAGCKDRTIKKRFVANIVVVNDPAHPENNGKNFLYEYGPSIQDIIIGAMAPKYADQAKVPVFDLWAGANFNLRSCEDKQFLSYKDSEFSPAGVLHPDDAFLEKVYNGMIDLTEFEKEEGNYKSYDELKKQCVKILGAKYVAGVLGEAFSPEEAASAGGNPFAQEQQAQGGFAAAQQAQGGFTPPVAQQSAVNADPFAAAQQPAATADANPFATQAQEPVVTADPFATQAQEPATSGTAPEAASDDPFANLQL